MLIARIARVVQQIDRCEHVRPHVVRRDDLVKRGKGPSGEQAFWLSVTKATIYVLTA